MHKKSKINNTQNLGTHINKHTHSHIGNHINKRITNALAKCIKSILLAVFCMFATIHIIHAQNPQQVPNTNNKINSDLKEGRDFIVLENPIPNAKNTIIEVFSYSCPFCYRYSKHLPNLIKSLPENVEFKPYHLSKKGDYGQLASQVFAVLVFKDKKANISITDAEKSHFYKAQKAYFNAYNINKERWGGGKNPQAFLHTGLDSAGVKLDDFYSTLQEKAVQEILASWEDSYGVATIQGIPAFVVNGKYLIYTKSIHSLEDLKYKIIELLKK